MSGSAHHPPVDTSFLPPQPAPPAPSPPRWKSWLGVLAWWVGGGVAGYAGGALIARFELEPGAWLPSASWPLTLLFAVLTLWPHIVLHEAGHAVAGLARGMRAIAFGVGPLRWERGLSRWRLRRGTGIAGIGGFAALLPQGERGLSRTDQALFLAGGPLANLLTAALALACLPLADGSPVLASFLIGSAACAAFLGAANLLPFHTQGWRSDGRGLLDLLQRSPDAALQQRINRLMALSMAGVRPRDWPQALVPEAVGASASPLLAMNGDLLRLSWAMDRGDPVQSAAAAGQAIARFNDLPEAFRPHVAIAVAGYVARLPRDRATLAAWRPLCEGGITDLSVMRYWLDAELAALSGDSAAARAAAAAARGRIDHAPDPTSALLLSEYLDDLEAGLAA